MGRTSRGRSTRKQARSKDASVTLRKRTAKRRVDTSKQNSSATVRRTSLRKLRLSKLHTDMTKDRSGSSRRNVKSSKGKNCTMTSSQYQEYLDTYMRNITNTDLGNLVNIGNRLDHISKENEICALPELGKHYKETWQVEDEKFAKKYGIDALRGYTSGTISPGVCSVGGVIEGSPDAKDLESIESIFSNTCDSARSLGQENKVMVDSIADISVIQQMSDKIRLSAEKILMKLASTVLDKTNNKE